MLGAYLDESHDSKKERIYVVAGYIAPAANWNCFWGAWDRALVEEGLPDFHMADCEGGYGSIYSQMPRERREELQRRFIGIITSSDIAGMGCGIELEAYNELRPEFDAERRLLPGAPVSGSIGDPYLLAFQGAIQEMAQYREVVSLPEEERIAFVFDRRKDLTGRVTYLYDHLCGAQNMPHVKRFGSLTFDDRKRMKPLQAADVLAYESFRYLNDRIAGRPERWQFTELRKRLGEFGYFGKDELLSLLNTIRADPWGRTPQ
jgi:hypothetical protein